jgi:hypothetical protein
MAISILILWLGAIALLYARDVEHCRRLGRVDRLRASDK